MNREIVVTGASELLTLGGPARARVGSEIADLGILKGGAVLIRDGVVEAVGLADDIVGKRSPDVQRIDAEGCVVTPGFVDAHTHPVFAGTRENEYELRSGGATYQQIAAAGGGILSTVKETRKASEDRLLELGRLHAGWMLEHGTTTAEAKSGYGLSLESELKILRVIRRLGEETPLELVPTFLGAHEIPPEYRGSEHDGHSREDYIRLLVDEMLPAVAAEKLAKFVDVFCEEHVFTIEETRRLLTRAKELGFGLRLHADQLSAGGGASLAAELGAACADHLEYISEEGIEALRRAGTTAVLLPGAVFNLRLDRYAPARRLIKAGVPVVLATDFNPGSSPTPSMQMVHSIACTQMGMNPAECFTASTINAAYSLGCGDRIGSLEPGKQADILIFDCSDYRQIPYFYGVNHVKTVIKRGEVVSQRPGHTVALRS